MSSELDLRIEVGELRGRMAAMESRASKFEDTLIGIDGKLDRIQDMIADRDSFMRGVVRTAAAVGTMLSIAAAWFAGLIPHH